ncbi:MAG: TldD/PmbA family protein [Candidatus Methanomethylicia archaeon]|nr:TldD/PmbA family protein [Candidatus Methanomethylicia archaeon]
MISLESILDIIDSVFKKPFDSDLTEVRFHSRRDLSILVRNGEVERISHGFISGFCARSLVNGSWGFSSTTNISIDGVKSIIDASIKSAKASRKYMSRRTSLAERKIFKDNYTTPMKKDPVNVDVNDMIKDCLDVHKHIRGISPSITLDTIGMGFVDDFLVYASSDGSLIIQRITRCSGTCSVIAREGGNIASGYESVGAQSGLEIFDETPLINAADVAAKRAVRLINAGVPKGGYHTVVLDRDIVGLLAHEAVGHTAEADLVYSGSYLAGKIGVEIASPLITLVDDGRIHRGFGTMMYDDEGTPTQKTIIIDKGVCKNYLHSRETAYEMGFEPTGNSRAWTFEYDPIIRMRNTYIEIGDYSFDELIEDVNEGYFLIGGRGGQADSTGEFMFGVQEVVEIKNGKLYDHLRGVTISGNAFEVLKAVDAIGKDFSLRRGMCGKEQPNYVGMGGPSIRTKVIVGGR